MEEQPNQPQTGTNTKRPSWARRKLLINEHFQLHFIGFTAVISLAACVFFYVASSYFFMTYHEYAVEVGLRPSDPFFRVLYNMEMLLTHIFIGTSVGVLLVSIVGGLIFSHRVAGPMYRMRRHLEAVARGETWANVGFRKKDYFEDVAVAYNDQMHYVRQKLGIDVATGDTGPIATRRLDASAPTPGPVELATPVSVNTEAEAKANVEADKDGIKKAS
ncbi:MAG: hypothetical protein HY074_14665 [Deltaproteobacteria bacterium]|nr:hypothetical protein [Deltaproteobacteria bacterium]